MGLMAKLGSKAGKIFQPVVNAAGKVMTKLDASKPEIMVGGGVVLVLVGTVWMLVQTRKVDDKMAECQGKMDAVEAKEAEMTKKEFQKAVLKVRSETIWEFIKLYGIPALMFIMGIFSLVGGHWVLKKRYILATTSLEGMKKFIEFVKQNVIEDQGEEKWKEYAYGKVDTKTIEQQCCLEDGTPVKKLSTVDICKPHDNPWLIEFSEDLFKSWRPNTETNLFFLQGSEKYFNDKYQKDKDAEISIYEVLDYLGADWSKFDKNYRTWLRNQVWGHHIYGDDEIKFGLHMALNDPARRRLSDKVFMEFNTDGEPKDVINRYRDPAWLAKQRAEVKRK